MPPDPAFPRMTLDEIVEELRDEAVDLAPDLEGIAAEETLSGQAAQTLEEYGAALARIRDGATDAPAIAKAALTHDAPLKPIGDAADTLKRLLKPRRE